MDMQFIRGARLLNQLNELSTFSDLLQNVVYGFPGTTARQNATGTVQIVNMSLQPFGPTNDLQCSATARNEGNVYQPKIMFLQVEYEDEDTNENVTFVGSDGDEYHIQPIALNQVNCKVACTCMDFYWRFALQNFDDGSLIGRKPPPYQRKTETRPPVNPANVPGVCKHIIKTVENLRNTGLVR